jgi:hypothetical protein
MQRRGVETCGGAAVLCVCLLTGCAVSTPPMDRSQSQVPAPQSGYVAQQTVDGADGVTVTWLEDESRIVITTSGSSSCPLVPLRTEERTLVLGHDADEGNVCSTDINPTSSTIESPPGWSPGISLIGVNRDGLLLISATS